MKIYEALADAFYREQVTTCFALLGDANMHWAAALADTGVKFFYTRHEHVAVAAAAAYSRCSGEVGVATVTCGPGLTQTMTILPIAVRAHIPLVIFAGEAPINKPWYNQGISQAPFVEACGAGYRALHNPQHMMGDVQRAFAEARQLQKPVVIGVPFDIQQHTFMADIDSIIRESEQVYCETSLPEPDCASVNKAVDWIVASKCPVLLAGLGATSNNARTACITLAENIGACLATTLPAKGLFYDQPYCLGVAGGFSTEGAKEIFAESDLVIGIGTSLASHTFDGGRLTPTARVIHVDTNPRTTVQGRKAADLLITADACAGAIALSNGLLQHDNGREQRWRTSQMKTKAAAALRLPDDCETPDGKLHPMAVISALANVIPAHCHIVNTSGHSAYYTAQMNQHPQCRYTVIREFGAIGNGTSFAIGVAAAYPDRPVVLLDGDGSALMHIQELETIQRHNMHVLVIVLNDGAYGSEVHKLRSDGVSDAGSVFGRADFAAIGRSFGLTGNTFLDLDNIEGAMQEFLMTRQAAIWDFHISDQIASPQIIKAHRATQH